jgi:hypothetical protein
MITVGTIFSIIGGGIYPILNILLGNIAGVLVSFENAKQNVTLSNKNVTNKW